MAVAFHSDSIEIQEEDDVENKTAELAEDDADYVNVGTKTSAQPKPTQKSGRCKLIGLVVGLLCGVQALLNIGLRLSLHSEPINNLTNLTNYLDHLQSGYDNVTAQKHQIQSGFDHLLSKYHNLTIDLDQMTKQKDDLQSRYNIITAERDELKRRLCGSPGWQRFGSSCYYISTESKSWEVSRQWCLDNQADLIIINSKEEKDFVNRVVIGNTWLGLTDSEQEGVWKWVDGTLISSPTYWNTGDPDGGRGQNCAGHFSGYAGWLDAPCTNTYHWMCEKVV